MTVFTARTGLRVAGLQIELAWEDRARNHEHAAEWIRTASAAGARLIVLPEMFPYGFSMNTRRIAEPWDGPSVAFLREQARVHDAWIGGSVPELDPGADRPANTFVLAGPDGTLHRYRKLHPFSFANEHEHYRAGDARVTLTIEGIRFTLFVCYDLRFADEFWATAETTDAYLVVANWPSKRRSHWSTLLRARAIENQAYVVGVNRVGSGGGLEYTGDSAIVDPWGESLATAASGETILLADIDAATVATARTQFPVLRDRR